MAVIADYTTLSDAVAAYLDRNELTAYVPNFIREAEQLIYRDLSHRGIETEFTATTSSGALALSGLTNFRNFKWIRASGQGGSLIEPMTISELYRSYPDRTAVAAFPSHYARDGANIIFGPAVDAITLDGVYYAQLPVLSASNTTNWYTANYPEILLYGALMGASSFLMDDPRLTVWATKLQMAREAIEGTDKKEARTGTPRSIQVR